mgnify:CR=1 FL=1
MNSSYVFQDKRTICGNRVLGKCNFIFDVLDPYSSFNSIKSGYVVMNMQGGSAYLGEHFHEDNLSSLFPDGKMAVISQLSLFIEKDTPLVLLNVKIRFIRLNAHKDREGIVFKFYDLNEEQMDQLAEAHQLLPAISDCEELSVPFEEVMTLNRDHHRSADSLRLVEL